MKVDLGKCQILFCSKDPDNACIDELCITSSSSNKLLGITTDSESNFDKHNSELCYKRSKKSDVLCLMVGYMSSANRSFNESVIWAII